MAIPFKKSPLEFNQGVLFPSNIFDLLAKDHECYVYIDLFEELDTSSLEKKYSRIGQNAYHPKQIVSILIYAYSRGVYSSRQIERRCKEDLGFMYVARMNCPNFRVLSDFRKDNAEFFQECFKQTVRLAIELKLTTLGHISLDGSKFKANSSRYKAMSYGRLKEAGEALSKEIDELIRKANRCDDAEDAAYKDKTGYEIPEDLKFKQGRLKKIKEAREALEKREEQLNPGKEIENKKQISYADKESRLMGKKGNFDYGYNGQVSVDKDSQIIVGQHVTQNANDKKEVKPAIEAIEDATGKTPKEMTLDNGYMSGDNLQTLEDRGIDGYIATNREDKKHTEALDESERNLVKADFVFDEESDSYTCPGKQKLVLKRERKDRRRIYQADISICNNCVYKSRCCGSEKGEARTISADDKEPLRRQMNAKMEKEESKEIYKHRKEIVEPVFGQIKNRGFRGFSVRGKDKVSGEFSLVCAVHNLKKITTAIIRGKVCLEFNKTQTNPVM